MRWALGAGSAAIVALGVLARPSDDLLLVAADAAAGCALFGVAFLARSRGFAGRYAAIAFLAATAWFGANLVERTMFLHRPLLVHVALSYPHGRLAHPVARAVVGATWVSAVALPVGANAPITAIIGLAVVAVGVGSAVANPGPSRQASLIRARASGLVGVAIAGPAAMRLFSPVSGLSLAVSTAHALAVAVAGLIVLVALADRASGAAVVADRVVELSETGSVRLDVVLESLHGGTPATALDPLVASATRTATELLRNNTRLQAELSDQVAHVQESRRELVQVADVERRRMQQRLSDVAGPQLDELDRTLVELRVTAGGGLADMVARTSREAESIRDDLDQLGRGLHPRLLAEEGLYRSLLSVAQRAGVHATVNAPGGRYPTSAETTVWYVCAEAVANVAKHARADALTVDVRDLGGQLVVTVTDDGVGGARLGSGGGLAGLADRVAAVGGRLDVGERPGGGTWLRAHIPLT